MREKVTKSVPYAVLGLTLLLLICLNLFCQDHWLDSDMAAEMIFSKLLAQEGHFFATPDWYYSTEFRFLYTHWIMGPLFHFLKNWQVIRAVTNMVSYLCVLASYYFFMKPLKVKRELVVSTSALLLLPFSETMMTHMVMGNTYLFHVIIIFCFFGLYLRLVGSKSSWKDTEQTAGKNRVKRAYYLIFFAVLGVVCGVSGVRYLLALQCPLVLAAFWSVLQSVEFAQFRRDFNGKNLREVFAPLRKSTAMKYFVYSLGGLMWSLVGYAVNVLYVCKNYVFQTYGATNFIAIYQGVLFERLQNAIGSLLMLFGYIPDRSVLSLRGVISVIAFGFVAIYTYCSVRAFQTNVGQRRFISRFLLLSFWLNVFVFVFTTSTMVPRYFITVWIFALPVLCFYLEKEELYFDRIVVVTLLTVSLLLATGKTVMSYLTVDKNASKRQVAEFLQEQNYSFGYATYWNANIVTELTDGAVEVANLDDVRHLEYFKWSSPMKYYADGYADGEVFLLLEKDEYTEAADSEVVKQGEVVYEDAAYTVLVYESAANLFRLAESR